MNCFLFTALSLLLINSSKQNGFPWPQTTNFCQSTDTMQFWSTGNSWAYSMQQRARQFQLFQRFQNEQNLKMKESRSRTRYSSWLSAHNQEYPNSIEFPHLCSKNNVLCEEGIDLLATWVQDFGKINMRVGKLMQGYNARDPYELIFKMCWAHKTDKEYRKQVAHQRLIDGVQNQNDFISNQANAIKLEVHTKEVREKAAKLVGDDREQADLDLSEINSENTTTVSTNLQNSGNKIDELDRSEISSESATTAPMSLKISENLSDAEIDLKDITLNEIKDSSPEQDVEEHLALRLTVFEKLKFASTLRPNQLKQLLKNRGENAKPISRKGKEKMLKKLKELFENKMGSPSDKKNKNTENETHNLNEECLRNLDDLNSKEIASGFDQKKNGTAKAFLDLRTSIEKATDLPQIIDCIPTMKPDELKKRLDSLGHNQYSKNTKKDRLQIILKRILEKKQQEENIKLEIALKRYTQQKNFIENSVSHEGHFQSHLVGENIIYAYELEHFILKFTFQDKIFILTGVIGEVVGYTTHKKEQINFEYSPSRSETQDGIRKDYVTGDPTVFFLPDMEQILFQDLTVTVTGKPMKALEQANESKKYQLK